MNAPQHRQQRLRGAAALEFALVLPVLVLILYGLVTFGSVLYTQLVVSRAAEDGARSVAQLTGETTYAAVTETVKTAIKDQVINSLANSSIVPTASSASFSSRQQWLDGNVRARITVDNGSCADTSTLSSVVRVRFDFPYSSARILPAISLPGLGSFDSWMPATLNGCAVVRL